MECATDIPQPAEDEIRAALENHSPRRIEPEGTRLAAVLVPIFQLEGKWHVLLTRRSQTVEHHKGEISFPGGHYEPEDPSYEYTALREAEEEVGIDPAGVRVLGRLDDHLTITDYRIRPFVGVIPYPFEVNPSDDEIDEVIVLPVSAFVTERCMTTRDFERNGVMIKVYFFDVNGYNVWGATAKILKKFLDLVFLERSFGLK